MLAYSEARKVFLDKLTQDHTSGGRFEAAMYSMVKHAYIKGFEDGQADRKAQVLEDTGDSLAIYQD